MRWNADSRNKAGHRHVRILEAAEPSGATFYALLYVGANKVMLSNRELLRGALSLAGLLALCLLAVAGALTTF